MVYTCVKCGEHAELREGRRTGGGVQEYEAMRKQLRKSFLKADVELCPTCLKDLVTFVNNRVGAKEFAEQAIRQVRHSFGRR
jgi:hypothetical protein